MRIVGSALRTLVAMSRLRPLVLVVTVAVVVLAAATVAAARVPKGFVGMVLSPPLFPNTDPNIDLTRQLDLMVSSGVESTRVAVDWASMQPYRSWSEVPMTDQARFQADGIDRVPTQFGQLDALVAPAAQRGLTVLPTVVDAPAWDAKHYKRADLSIPSSDGPYGSFLKALVLRYGPHGSFWRGRSPKVPIRMWQVWNEPNEPAYWPIQPFARSYVALLRVAHAAIKGADPGAKVVLAGMSNYSWDYLAGIYNVQGARSLFDVVGVHPYTREPQGVITITSYVRRVMDSHGDSRKPIIDDEMGWPSSLGQSAFNYSFGTTEAGQARNTAAVLKMLGANRRRLGLLGFDYYTWAGVESRTGNTFDFAGLWRINAGRFIAKPALNAFSRAALALESCHKKASVATRCLS